MKQFGTKNGKTSKYFIYNHAQLQYNLWKAKVGCRNNKIALFLKGFCSDYISFIVVVPKLPQSGLLITAGLAPTRLELVLGDESACDIDYLRLLVQQWDEDVQDEVVSARSHI